MKSLEFGNTICLVLCNQHFNLIRWDKITQDWKDFILKSKPQGQGDNIPITYDNVCKPTLHRNKPTYIIPFKSEHAAKKITAYKHQLKSSSEFNITFKTTTKIIDLTKRLEQTIERNTKTGPIASSTQKVESEKMDETHGVVYKATCKQCAKSNVNKEYIGETGRSLKTRIHEHMRKIKDGTSDAEIPSAIGAHSHLAHNEQPTLENWNFKILANAATTQKRKILEALAIKQYCPNLNRDVGVYTLPIDYTYKFKNITV
jgi:hypothetical protein